MSKERFKPSSAGKGPDSRVTDFKKYQKGHSDIDWSKKCECGGKLIEASQHDDWDGMLTCKKCKKRSKQ